MVTEKQLKALEKGRNIAIKKIKEMSKERKQKALEKGNKVIVMRASSYSQIKNRSGRHPFCMVCKREIEVEDFYKTRRSGNKGKDSLYRRFHLDCWNNVFCYFCGKRIDMDKNWQYVTHHINGNHRDERPQNVTNSHRSCHISHHNTEPWNKRPKSEEHMKVLQKGRREWWDSLSEEEKSERQRTKAVLGGKALARKRKSTLEGRYFLTKVLPSAGGRAKARKYREKVKGRN